MRGVLSREPCFNCSGDKTAHLVSETLNLGERGVFWRTVPTKPARRKRRDALLELFQCLFREHDRILSFLAHASFLSK